jgi:hypothetical protein
MKQATRYKILMMSFVLAGVMFWCAPLKAQDVSVTPQQAAAAEPSATAPSITTVNAAPGQPVEISTGSKSDDVNPNDIAPVIFTYWEHVAINDARNARGAVRPPTEEELAHDLHKAPDEKIKPPPEDREIKLGGIMFISGKDWTIWLNGKRVTPQAIPKEIIDLKVFKEYVEMKWFDDYTNQIFPLRLRTHERFNIDSRIFLPG